METFGTDDVSLWDEADGFFYDVLVGPDGRSEPVRLRSLVGLLPLIAVAHAPDWITRELPDFVARMRWLQRRRPDLTDALVVARRGPGGDQPRPAHRGPGAGIDDQAVRRGQFLGPTSDRCQPPTAAGDPRRGRGVDVGGLRPGESTTNLFGGNSNWRGPVWFPINVLLIDGLRGHARAAGEAPRSSTPPGRAHPRPGEVADDLEQRLVSLFRPGADGRRPGTPRDHPSGPLWDVHPTFAEYFDGDTGRGCGASHQTGWTALVAHLICARPLS